MAEPIFVRVVVAAIMKGLEATLAVRAVAAFSPLLLFAYSHLSNIIGQL